MSTCKCSPARQAASQMGVFSVAKLAMPGKASKEGKASKKAERVLKSSVVFGGSALVYDYWIKDLWSGSSGKDYSLSPWMMKTIYEIFIQELYRVTMSKNKKIIDVPSLLENSIAVFAANYGLEML